MTEGYPPEQKARVAEKVVVVTILTLVLFALAGNYIFLVFHTTIHAFRIAGGILLFSIAFTMMHGQRPKAKLTDVEREEALSREMVGVVPLGIPMFAGPGAITTTMVLMAEASVPSLNLLKIGLVLVSVVVTMGIAYTLMLRADWIIQRFGRVSMMAFGRIMGLILAAIAIQFIIVGFQGAWVEYFAQVI